MLLFINYPAFIHPQIFSGIPFLRWYGLMYIFAFATAYLVLRKLFNEGFLDDEGALTKTQKVTSDDIFSFISFGILFLLIGARVFSTLIYDTSGLYREKPWLVFWPFNAHGKFTGFAGMSYHGGFIGGLLGMIVWCKVHKRPALRWIDAMVAAIPLGYTFGRLGNFLNGELYGRVTTAPWGVIFPSAEEFSTAIPWVKDFCQKIGLDITGQAMVNLPRHPSQLYEAFFEGVVLWLLVFNLRKLSKANGKRWDGLMGAAYTIGYGVVRFIIEYFREPDGDLGYRIAKGLETDIHRTTSLLNISTGQILCALMIVGGVAMLLVTRHLAKKAGSTQSAKG